MTRSGHASESEAFFNPNAIALIGASSSPARIGGRTLASLLKHGFAGRIYPINPSHDVIQGLKAYARIEDVPDPVDLAIISVPAAEVLAALRSCIAKGVRGVVIYSSGFSEAGGDGVGMQATIRFLARRAGVRVLGPNCLGFMSLPSKTVCTFGQAPNIGLPNGGGVSIVSQSGAFGTYTYAAGLFRRMPISRWITTGNEADVDFSDCVEWLVQDPETKVIMGYMEGCRDGDSLIRALENARCAGKPVVILKVGRSAAGASAAQSHTAALAGDDQVYDAVFRRYGVCRAASLEEFFDAGYAFLHGLAPKGKRAAVITASGGAGVLIADEVSAQGFSLPPVPDDIQIHLKRLVPFAGVGNPIDVTAQVGNDPQLFSQFFSAVAGTGLYDAIFCFQGLSGINREPSERLLNRWTELREKFPDLPIFISAMAKPEVAAALEAKNIPVFDDPSRMVRAAAAMCDRQNADVMLRPESVSTSVAWPKLNEIEAMGFLSRAGIPMAAGAVAKSAEEAAARARKIGFPVVLKILSAEIQHKSDVGGVAVGLTDEAMVRQAYENVVSSARRHLPYAPIDGVLVAPMVKGGVEAIIGARIDPVFGPMVMVGLGGTMVEVLKDVSFCLAPLSLSEARSALDRLRGAAILDGARGNAAADKEALAEALVRLGDFASTHAGSIKSVEINPLLVKAKGEGVIGLDALIS
ncbi:MAG: acetate--CoA ligase family protein [Rhizomicrobium sp.]